MKIQKKITVSASRFYHTLEHDVQSCDHKIFLLQTFPCFHRIKRSREP